jgi:ParB-like chromosome segregation protein Spo0J
MNENGANDGGVRLSFERASVIVALSNLTLLKSLPADFKENRRYKQIVRSVGAIGLVEAPVVAPDPRRRGHYFLLDGHLRIEALKEIGVSEVECLVSTDDEAYTYNKRINRLAAVQEHRMVACRFRRRRPSITG